MSISAASSSSGAPRRARSRSRCSEIAFSGFLISCATPPVMRLMAARREATSSWDGHALQQLIEIVLHLAGLLARAAKLLAQQVQFAFHRGELLGHAVRRLSRRRRNLPCTMRSMVCSMRRSGRSTQLVAKAVSSSDRQQRGAGDPSQPLDIGQQRRCEAARWK